MKQARLEVRSLLFAAVGVAWMLLTGYQVSEYLSTLSEAEHGDNKPIPVSMAGPLWP